MMMTRNFKGANVFMSRNLIPPELFDSLHDALKHNGADVFLCCDPSRNGPNDYHIISSRDHEKFGDLSSKGCNLLGPHCVLSCAKECRPLPKQKFTCCLAMDGVKVLASGFEMDEKVEIGNLMASMGGVLHMKASPDVSFVIVKNVLAAKYKWALNILKKPIVTINWLHQCWKEHRVVPQESFKVPPFSGLIICVTRIPADERKEMEKVIVQNGGKYSAELTKKCTHLVCDAPEGDKYKVAKKWGHIYLVTRKWFDQSIARRACLNEESYPIRGVSASSASVAQTSSIVQHSKDKTSEIWQCAESSMAVDSNLQPVLRSGATDPDLEATVSQNMTSTISDAPIFSKELNDTCGMHTKDDVTIDACVADDSQTEDNDLYLSDCRILLVGFDASEKRKLINMIRRGGGSRYMSYNEKLTHIVVGTLSDSEKKDVRAHAALGVIHVVRTEWLEDCERQKKEIPVVQRHNAHDLLYPKDPAYCTKRPATNTCSMKRGTSSSIQSNLPDDQSQYMSSTIGRSLVKGIEQEFIMAKDSFLSATTRSANQSQTSTVNGNYRSGQELHNRSGTNNQEKLPSNVFKEKLFRFSSSFPEERRAEIVEWVKQGGGEVVDDQIERNVHYTVECHGSIPNPVDNFNCTKVSSHWIRSCLEDGCLLDVGSHILYSPLTCHVPLPGFENFRFSVSQYDEKDRLLLRNLCFILGSKLVEKLTKKVTHLLCKYTSGPKYEAACKWGIQPVTSEWIYECVKQSKVVAPGPFCPKEVTSQDREAGYCTMSQYPTQAATMFSGDDASQFASQACDITNIQLQVGGGRSNYAKKERKESNICGKRARILDDVSQKRALSSELHKTGSICRITSTDDNITDNAGEDSVAVPDVAAAIEDLLEQTSKIQDSKSPERNGCDKSLFSPDCSLCQEHSDPKSAFGLNKRWMNRIDRMDDNCKPTAESTIGLYDGFSETQTESQVVGYEEDLSGRQMIIDRVRTRSSLA